MTEACGSPSEMGTSAVLTSVHVGSTVMSRATSPMAISEPTTSMPAADATPVRSIGTFNTGPPMGPVRPVFCSRIAAWLEPTSMEIAAIRAPRSRTATTATMLRVRLVDGGATAPDRSFLGI